MIECNITDKELNLFFELLATTSFPYVQSLNLTNTKMGHLSCKTLAAYIGSNSCRLKCLKLCEEKLYPNDVREYLAPALQQNKSLELLNLTGNDFNNDDMICICENLKGHPSLTDLYILEGNNFNSSLDIALSNLIENSRIIEVEPIVLEKFSLLLCRRKIKEMRCSLNQEKNNYWNSLDNALDLSRKDMVSFAMQNSSSCLFRQLLMPEIIQSVLLTSINIPDRNVNERANILMEIYPAIYNCYIRGEYIILPEGMWSPELVQLIDNLAQSFENLSRAARKYDRTKLQAIAKENNKQAVSIVDNIMNSGLAPVAEPTHQELECPFLVQEKPSKAVLEELMDESKIRPQEISSEYSGLKELFTDLKRRQAALEEYCSRQQVYEQYIQEHYGSKGYFLPLHNDTNTISNPTGKSTRTSMLNIIAHMLHEDSALEVGQKISATCLFFHKIEGNENIKQKTIQLIHLQAGNFELHKVITPSKIMGEMPAHSSNAGSETVTTSPGITNKTSATTTTCILHTESSSPFLNLATALTSTPEISLGHSNPISPSTTGQTFFLGRLSLLRQLPRRMAL